MIFTRKVQVTQARDDKTVTLAEVKGAVREVEVYPGQSAEWWFVPVATGRVTDLRCGISGSDGKTHADHGMVYFTSFRTRFGEDAGKLLVIDQ